MVNRKFHIQVMETKTDLYENKGLKEIVDKYKDV